MLSWIIFSFSNSSRSKDIFKYWYYTMSIPSKRFHEIIKKYVHTYEWMIYSGFISLKKTTLQAAQEKQQQQQQWK